MTYSVPSGSCATTTEDNLTAADLVAHLGGDTLGASDGREESREGLAVDVGGELEKSLLDRVGNSLDAVQAGGQFGVDLIRHDASLGVGLGESDGRGHRYFGDGH
jgi:hypothetical protein